MRRLPAVAVAVKIEEKAVAQAIAQVGVGYATKWESEQHPCAVAKDAKGGFRELGSAEMGRLPAVAVAVMTHPPAALCAFRMPYGAGRLATV